MIAKIVFASGMSVRASAAMGVPIMIQGFLRPKRVQVWSLFVPAQGETSTLKILSQVMMKNVRLGVRPKPAMLGISRPASINCRSNSGLPACKKSGTKLLNTGQTRLIPKKPTPISSVFPYGNFFCDIKDPLKRIFLTNQITLQGFNSYLGNEKPIRKVQNWRYI